jgi:hypothetical protein
MAEALASLKEGLRETADPLYDSWKLRQVASDRPVVLDVETDAARASGASAEPGPSEAAPRPPKPRGADPAERLEPIDIALEGTPPETPGASSIPDAAAGDAPLDGIPTEDLLVEFDEEFEKGDAETTSVRYPSVQADTVRVRVIRYRPFPRWALVAAASFVVFAISLVALRAGLQGESTRVALPVLAPEVPTSLPVPPTRTLSPTNVLAANAALANAVAPVPAKSAAPLGAAPLNEHAAADDVPAVESPAAIGAPTATSAGPPRSAAPAAKTSPPPKRRSGAQDFFRDPGF